MFLHIQNIIPLQDEHSYIHNIKLHSTFTKNIVLKLKLYFQYQLLLISKTTRVVITRTYAHNITWGCLFATQPQSMIVDAWESLLFQVWDHA